MSATSAALMFRSRRNSVVDALVSLDTTQDYYSLADTRWQELTTTVTGSHFATFATLRGTWRVGR